MSKTKEEKTVEESQNEKMPHEKCLYMAQKELMNKSEAMVDVIINLNNMVETSADRWSVSYDYLMEWLLGILPFKRTTDDVEDED